MSITLYECCSSFWRWSCEQQRHGCFSQGVHFLVKGNKQKPRKFISTVISETNPCYEESKTGCCDRDGELTLFRFIEREGLFEAMSLDKTRMVRRNQPCEDWGRAFYAERMLTAKDPKLGMFKTEQEGLCRYKVVNEDKTGKKILETGDQILSRRLWLEISILYQF